MKNRNINILQYIIFAIIVSLSVFIFKYGYEKYGIKSLILISIIIFIGIGSFFLKPDKIVYLIIFLSFFNIPMVSLYTSSTNIIIFYSAFILLIRSGFGEKSAISFYLLRRSSVTFPIALIILSYTISFLFVEKGWNHHLLFYQSIICSSILIMMIVGMISEKRQIIKINKILLSVLIINLCYTFVLMFYPQLDSIVAKELSLNILKGEAATRSHGISFRGEAYGEYLMICSLWLFTMLSTIQFKRGKIVLWFIAICSISVLILTRSRGANIVFLFGILIFLFSSKSITIPKKMISIIGIVSMFACIVLIMNAVTEISLLDRFYYFLDKNEKIENIPRTRYYTWIPAIRLSEKNNFLGIGPSFRPYQEDITFRDVVNDKARGNVTIWPHNITILILCTVGIYGLMSYIFLLYRTFRLRKICQTLEPYLANTYSSYLLCFFMFLIEGQKFDGVLRYAGASLYFISILIALLFTCENMYIVSKINHKNKNN